MRVLYAGDSPAGGPAHYLLGILRRMKAQVKHLAPEERLSPSTLQAPYDGIILSDFSRDHVPDKSQKLIEGQVKKGAGLLMVGGWASFSGPYGGWHGSLVEKLLPVTCLGRDDLVSFPAGALILEKVKHPMFRSVSFTNPPSIAGLNRFLPKKGSITILAARRILARLPLTPTLSPKGRGQRGSFRRGQGEGVIRLEEREYPLLVVDRERRVAALATDLAPHWSGGLLDWGRRRLTLPAHDVITIEVGETYVRFVSSLLKWLTNVELDPRYSPKELAGRFKRSNSLEGLEGIFRLAKALNQLK
ncbi:MAG: hypothetical protein HYU34_04695 [Candidatus Omnitrophica bacterium]|nr:hypothetical protein [Candidatus Omnitrophota bacterium]